LNDRRDLEEGQERTLSLLEGTCSWGGLGFPAKEKRIEQAIGKLLQVEDSKFFAVVKPRTLRKDPAHHRGRGLCSKEKMIRGQADRELVSPTYS